MGGMTPRHPELKELELEKRTVKGERENMNRSLTPLHVQFPRRWSQNTLPATQRAAASPPQIIPEIVSNPRHPERLSTLPEKILELYGRLCPDLPPAGRLSPHRTRAVLRIVEKYPSSQSLEWWETYFARAAESSFLAGSGPGGWKANLDWLLVSWNVINVLAGNYDDTSQSRPKGTEESLEQYVDRMVAALENYCHDDT